MSDDLKFTVQRIAPRQGWVGLDLAELFQYRRLLTIFAWRDVQSRYKQTFAGITWVLIQPLMTMVVFSVFFGRFLGVSSGDVPYPVFTFCALVPWTYFVHALTVSSTSVSGNAQVISKIYFPRLILPMASVLGGLVDILTSVLVLIPLLLFHGVNPGLNVLLLPLFVVLAMMTAFAAGVWLAAVNVRFRDVNQAMPFVTQLWLFATPVAYPIDVIPERWRLLCELNPMATVVQGFRWALSGAEAPTMRMVGLSLTVVLVTMIAGLFWFRHEEASFSDVV